jgi:hypothetical protein
MRGLAVPRAHRRARAVALLVSAMVVAVALPATPANAATAASPITYVYDELGRLEAVIDPDAPFNGVARYNYDENGNILSIARSSHTSISIIDFHGNRGEVGDEVTIYGTALGSSIGTNEVRFTNAGGQSGSSGQAATVLSATTTTLTVTVPSGSGDGPIWVRNSGSGQSVLSIESFDFLGAAGSQVPTISGFTPTSGDVGTSVTISGTGFYTDPSLNVVTFNDSRAVVSAATSTQLTVAVPTGATTGAIEVRTPEGLVRSSGDFLMPIDKRYSTLQPAQVGSNFWRLVVGGSRSITLAGGAKGAVVFEGTRKAEVSIQITTTGGFGVLDVSWLDPFDYWLHHAGFLGNHTSPTTALPFDGDYAVALRNASGGGSVTFTLTVQDQSGEELAPALSTQPASERRTLDPSALASELADAPEPTVWRPEAGRNPWVSGKEPTPFEWIRLPTAPEGITAVAGQVLSIDGYPIEGVEVSSGTVSTATDAYGRFLLEGVAPGYPTLFIDGRPANEGSIRFTSYEAGVRTRTGETTELEDVFWMPRIDPTTSVRVPVVTRREIVLRHPSMPGLEVHVPAGNRLTGPDGEPIGELTLMPVPLDRAPFPVPPGVGSPVYWTLQPGPVRVEGPGVWVTYPNAAKHPPGAKLDLWYYEPDEGWETYGKGTVDPTGGLISGEAHRIHYLDGVMVFGGLIPPGADAYCQIEEVLDPNPERPRSADQGNCEGDPVDASNGLFRYRQTDLVEPGPMPISITRAYRQNDSNMYIFGRGVTIPEQMGLSRVTAGDNCVVDLVIPGERRIRFVSPNYPSNPSLCNSDAEAAATPLVASAHPGAFQNATLRLVDLNHGVIFYDKFWLLERRDGTDYQFDYLSSSSGGRLVKVTDRTGNAKIVNAADSSNWRINSIVAYPSARWVKLNYGVIALGTSA